MENEIRSKYDSLVVYLYSTRREHILPEHFRKSIPYTTISNWRKTNYSSFKGSEYREKFEETFLNAELQQEHKKMKTGLRSLIRSWTLLRNILSPVIKKAGSDKGQQRLILQPIELLKNEVGTERALRLLGWGSKKWWKDWSKGLNLN